MQEVILVLFGKKCKRVQTTELNISKGKCLRLEHFLFINVLFCQVCNAASPLLSSMATCYNMEDLRWY